MLVFRRVFIFVYNRIRNYIICVREKSNGLITNYIFIGKSCKTEITIFSENQTESQMVDFNTSAVAGIMNVGAGYSQLETITSAFDIPSMSQLIYNCCL